MGRNDCEIQDLMDPFFHLYRTQFLGGGAVGAAWSRIRPHLGPPPPKWLNLAAKKRLQKVHPEQPIQ
jgi:hypothetical protein